MPDVEGITGRSYAATGPAIMVNGSGGRMLTMGILRTEVSHAAMGATGDAGESLPRKYQRQKQRQLQIDDPARFHSCANITSQSAYYT
jgi:hypothetical protein